LFSLVLPLLLLLLLLLSVPYIPRRCLALPSPSFFGLFLSSSSSPTLAIAILDFACPSLGLSLSYFPCFALFSLAVHYIPLQTLMLAAAIAAAAASAAAAAVVGAVSACGVAGAAVAIAAAVTVAAGPRIV
jgi:hypothetical protein